MIESTMPAHWADVPLHELAAVRYGKAKPFKEGIVPVVGSSGIYARTAEASVDWPTLVVGRKGTAGKVWMIEESCWPSDTAFYLEWIGSGRSDLQYLYYAMNARPLSGEHARTTMPSLQKSALENFRFWLPPFPEQRAIAAALRAVQDARDARRRELDAERERKAALMEDLFTYGIRGESQKETEIGSVPQSWRVAPLGQFLRERLKNGHSAKEASDRHGVRTFTLTAVTKNDFSVKNSKVTVADPCKVSDLWVKYGDIFIERGNTPELVGLAAMYTGEDDMAIYPDLLVRIRVDATRLSPLFLIHSLATGTCRRYYRRNASGTAGSMPKIDHGIISRTPLPVPPIVEQRDIAEVLTACDAKIAALEAEAALHDELFRALLDDLMTGRVSAVSMIKTTGDGS